MNNMLSGNEQPYEVTAVRKDGITFPAEIQARELDYFNQKLRVTALRDISLRKRPKKETRKAKELAEFANHTKSKFLVI